MNALRLMLVGPVLMSLAACATPVTPRADEPILEVLDRVESASPAQGQSGCAGVTYCQLDMNERRCTCRNPAEVARWLERVKGAARPGEPAL